MKILFVNTYPSGGGAAHAAVRQLKALRQAGIDAKLLTLHPDASRQDYYDALISGRVTKLKARWKFLDERIGIYRRNGFNRAHLFKVSSARNGFDISQHPWVREADVIHLHWINQGFLSLESLRRLSQLGKPIVWTMHDFWPFTGICHVPLTFVAGSPIFCHRYSHGCGECPLLGSYNPKDLSHSTFTDKCFLSAEPFHFVAVSHWLAQAAAQSPLVGNRKPMVIPNTIDTQVFHPRNDTPLPSSIPFGKILLVLSAARPDHEVKGADLCTAAIRRFCHYYPDLAAGCCLVIVGEIRRKDLFDHLPIEVVATGKIGSADTIAGIYTHAAVTLSTSYMETFGQTLIEANACGCPVVSFDHGGQTDIITPNENGYLVSSFDVEAMAHAIYQTFLLGNTPEGREQCIRSATRFQAETVAHKMIDYYHSIL